MALAEKKAVLSLRGVEKRFGLKRSLDGLDLDVCSGEFISLFGRNGAGKTTLLKVVSGLQGVSCGSVEARSGILDRSRIGYISHQVMLYPELSGFENLEMFAELHGLPDPKERAVRMISRIDLEEDSGRLVRDYSRGMMQRLSLGRALINDPELLLLDEPYTGLDRQGTEFLTELLREARQGGKTVIMATHDLENGYELADRLVVLQKGKIILDNCVEDLSFSDFIALFDGVSGK